ncbi:MAG: CHAT domain-containing tetratricopeptide repeat protein [Chitinophagales bacterium]
MIERDNIFDQSQQLTEAAQYQEAIALLQHSISTFETKQDWENYIHACNEIGKNYNHLSKTEKALHYLQFSLQCADENLPRQHLQLAHAHNNIAYTYSLLGDFEKVLHHYQQALHIFQQCYVDNLHPDLAMINSNLGWFFGEKGDVPQAIIHHQQAIHIYLQTLGANHAQTAIAYNNTGYVYGLKNDYTNALIYYQQAFHIWKQTLGAAHPQLIHAYNNIGWCHRMNEKFSESIDHYTKALELCHNNLGEQHATTAQVHHNMGSCYSLQNEFDKSLEQYQQALQIQTTLYGNQHPSIAQSLMNIGMDKGKQKEFDAAFIYLQQSLEQYRQFVGENHPRIAAVCNEIGNIYRRSGQFDKAISTFHQVLQTVLSDYQNAEIEAIPKLQSYQDENALLYALNGKAASFWEKYQEIQMQSSNENSRYNNPNFNPSILQNPNSATPQPFNIPTHQHLIAAFRHFEVAVNLIQQIRQSYRADGAKLSLSKSILPVYEGAIRTAFELFEATKSMNYLQKAFAFSEQGKSMVLLGNLKNNEAIAVSKIPSELQLQIQQLEVELRYLDKKITQEQTKNAAEQDAEYFRELQQKHFNFNEKYQSLIEVLETDYVDYFQLKYAAQNIHLQDVQSQMTETRVFIEYFVGEETISIFTITQQACWGTVLTKPTHFASMMDVFLQAIEWMDEEMFIDSANQLYDLLLEPIEVHWRDKKEWVIVRDDVLHLLPFDALLLPSSTAIVDTSFADLSYLVKHCAIAYHYSANLWNYSRKRDLKKAASSNNFLGIAPVVFQGTSSPDKTAALAWTTHRGKTKVLRNIEGNEETLQNLPSTALEVKQVYELFQEQEMDAKLFLYAAASKQVFFEEVPKHKYVLIATHGFVHDQHQDLSGIYLSDSASNDSLQPTNYLLTIPEIYHLHLQADLIVLSSCSSGVGKLYKGEGMMALNRGFLYAGASNIIFTQFDIPDESSSQLVRNLFAYILDEDSYAVALQKAKCKQLALPDTSPQDWAGFAYIGLFTQMQ